MPRPPLDQLRAVTQPVAVLSRRNAEHWVALLYGRRVSLRVTWLLVGTPMTANAVTTGMIGVGLVAASALLLPSWIGSVLCAIGIQLYLILDCVDGEIARWQRTESPRGIYLDRLGHYVVEAALLTAFGARVGSSIDSGWLSVGLATALLAVIAKAETDLVGSVVGPDKPTAEVERSRAEPSHGLVRALRAAVHPLRIHRLTGAVEASLLIVCASLLTATVWPDAEQVAAVTLLAVAAAVALGHAISILSSGRLHSSS